MAANGIVREALGDLDARLDHWRQTLVDLCRIPSVSAAGFPAEEVRRSAEAMAQALRDAGVEHVEVLEIPGAPLLRPQAATPAGATTNITMSRTRPLVGRSPDGRGSRAQQTS